MLEINPDGLIPLIEQVRFTIKGRVGFIKDGLFFGEQVRIKDIQSYTIEPIYDFGLLSNHTQDPEPDIEWEGDFIVS